MRFNEYLSVLVYKLVLVINLINGKALSEKEKSCKSALNLINLAKQTLNREIKYEDGRQPWQLEILWISFIQKRTHSHANIPKEMLDNIPISLHVHTLWKQHNTKIFYTWYTNFPAGGKENFYLLIHVVYSGFAFCMFIMYPLLRIKFNNTSEQNIHRYYRVYILVVPALLFFHFSPR